jgi:hypothetical protein
MAFTRSLSDARAFQILDKKNGMADPIAAFKHAFDNQGDAYTGFAQGLGTIVQAHVSSAQQALGHHLEHNQKGLGKLSSAFMSPVLYPQWLEYLSDAGQRAVLFTDAMRQCGNYFVEHENNANKTVLSWDHEVVVDGSKLDRPVNYSLVRIIASEDIRVREDGRPYIIIDPRAGHGSGIGGFKHESEVGAAIHEGHPVYFVTFTRLPQPIRPWSMSLPRRQSSCARCGAVIRIHPSRSSSATVRVAGLPCCWQQPIQISPVRSLLTGRLCRIGLGKKGRTRCAISVAWSVAVR